VIGMAQSPAGSSDWRLLPAAGSAWAMSVLIPGRSGRAVALAVVAGLLIACGAAWWHWRRVPDRQSVPAAVMLCGLTAAVASVVTWAHVAAAWAGPVPGLAARGQVVRGDLVVTADPVVRPSAFGDGSYVVVRGRLSRVRADGVTVRVRTPVLVTAPSSWTKVQVGAHLAVLGRLAATEAGADIAAVLSVRSPPHQARAPNALLRFAGYLRAALRHSVSRLPPDQRALVPALVDGDVTAMPADLTAAFKATGLTHLSAVSGTNLSILLALVLAVARPLRVRGRARLLVGLATVGFFVLLARPEPSVLRSAVMGLVVVLGAGAGHRRAGLPVLAAATIALVLIDPWLGATIGFVLSVLATAGLLMLAPRLAEALAHWLPASAAGALAVPLAAHLTTMPVIAAISASVSLAAVPANLLAEPAVGPATVLGLALTVVAAIAPAAAQVLAWLAYLPAWWIATVARVGASLPGHAVSLTDGGSGTLAAGPSGHEVGAWSVAAVVGIALLAIWLGPKILRSRRASVLCAVLLGTAMLVGPTLLLEPLRRGADRLAGWPPDDWRIVACDVGQGDGLALRAGPHAAVVVDSGRDPGPMRACLDNLGVTDVPYLLFTHFDADHVGGAAGVFAGRRVGRVGVSGFRPVPPAGQRALELASAAGVPVATAQVGERMGAGDVSWVTLAAGTGSAPSADGVPETAENDASVVWRVEVDGISVLMTGDLGPSGQAALLAAAQARSGLLTVDVLKVPHHGSRYQDPAFLAATHARVAIVSVGIDNDYGHPNGGVLAMLRGDGAAVYRTDLDGAVAIAGTHEHLRVVTRRHARLPDPHVTTAALPPGVVRGKVGTDERHP